MLRTLPLKKLVAEIRYKHSLAFYGHMDQIGLDLANEFPDWQRTPLTLEIRNKKKHQRLYLSHLRSFYDTDKADPDTAFRPAGEYLKQICEKLSLTTLQRVGVREWFAADLGKTFAVMVDEVAERFLSKSEQLSSILSDKTNDVVYIEVFDTDDNWKYRLQLGPMEKKQWFQFVSHEPNIFESPEEGTETLEKFRESIPDQFLYIDIDCYIEDHPATKLGGFLDSARTKSHDLVTKLIEFCKR